MTNKGSTYLQTGVSSTRMATSSTSTDMMSLAATTTTTTSTTHQRKRLKLCQRRRPAINSRAKNLTVIITRLVNRRAILIGMNRLLISIRAKGTTDIPAATEAKLLLATQE